MSPSDDEESGLRLDLGGLVNLLVAGHFDAFVASVGAVTPVHLLNLVNEFGAPLVPTPNAECQSILFTPARDGSGSVIGDVPLWTSEGPTGVGIRFLASPSLDGFWDYTVLEIVEVARPAPGVADREPARSQPAEPRRVQRQLAEHPVPDRWRPVLGALVDRLVAGDYAGLAADGLVWSTDDPTDESVGDFIEMYPDTLVEMPADGWLYSEQGASREVVGFEASTGVHHVVGPSA